MNRSTYILILILLCLNFWNIKPIGLLPQDAILVSTFMYLIAGILFYPNRSAVFKKKYYTPINWIFVGIFLSMIPAYLVYHQSIIQSLITYRQQYLMSIPFFLARIRPTKDDVLKALNTFSYIYGIFLFLKVIMPSLYVVDIEKEVFRSTTNNSIYLEGYTLMTIPLYYTLQLLVRKLTIKRMLYAFYIVALIFLSDNRSTLFPVLLLSGYMILKLKSSKKYFVIVLVAILGIYLMADRIFELIEETHTELDKGEGNRERAFMYFIFEGSNNILCAIFGNGLLSLNSTSRLMDLMNLGIYNSDLGFIGYWNQFGIIPIIVFFYIYIGTIKNKGIPIYLKLTSIQTLICGLTISYFARPYSIIFFVLFYYLYGLALKDIHVHHQIDKKKYHVGNSNSRLQKL